MRRKTKTFAFVFALLAWSGYLSASRGEDSRDPSISPTRGSIARPTETLTLRT